MELFVFDFPEVFVFIHQLADGAYGPQLEPGHGPARTFLGVLQVVAFFNDLSDKGDHFGIFLERRFDERAESSSSAGRWVRCSLFSSLRA